MNERKVREHVEADSTIAMKMLCTCIEWIVFHTCYREVHP